MEPKRMDAVDRQSRHFLQTVNELKAALNLVLGIGTGNPGVFQGYPYPDPTKTRTRRQGKGFSGLGSGFLGSEGS